LGFTIVKEANIPECLKEDITLTRNDLLALISVVVMQSQTLKFGRQTCNLEIKK
jgi:hypothetical protein